MARYNAVLFINGQPVAVFGDRAYLKAKGVLKEEDENEEGGKD